jgi:hypothetical protein
MGYEIWDRYERALINDFDTEVQALDYLRERVRPLTTEAGARWLDRLQLVRVFEDGQATEVISEGVDLLSRIFALTPAQ